MKFLQYRIPGLLILLVAVQLVTVLMYRQYSQVSVLPMTQSLEGLPDVLDGWSGESAESDPNLLRAIDADDLINRQYQKDIEWPISLHCATFYSLDHWMPHTPLECYPGAGWRLKRDAIVRDDANPQQAMHWVEFGNETGTVQVLYWYQRGEDVYFTREGARDSRQNIWGRETCPPLVKVILQTDGRAGEKGKENLLKLSGAIRQWIKDHGSSPAMSPGDALTVRRSLMPGGHPRSNPPTDALVVVAREAGLGASHFAMVPHHEWICN